MTATSTALANLSLEKQLKPSHRKVWLLLSILLLAVIVRLAWRLHLGSTDFWASGYYFFYDLASNLAAGRGLELDGDRAMRMPAYPLFLALTAFWGKSYLWIVVPQALMGAGTVLFAYLIGRELFGESSGILAGLLTAIYPYYVVHDTALQETGMFTFLTAVSIFLLLRARRAKSVVLWTMAGLALGAAVLTRQTLLPFAAGAVVWIGWFGEGSRQRKLARLVAVAAPLCVVIGLWVARNYKVTGALVMTSEFGRQLWNANNPRTFSHYPSESIDVSEDEAFTQLTLAEQQKLNGMTDEIVRSDWYQQKAIEYMRSKPLETVRSGERKILAAFSWNFNPKRGTLVEAAYLLSYGPISILGVIGMVLTRRYWMGHGLIYLLFLTFIAVTAVFWANTSHRSYLDVYWIVFAAYVLNRLLGQRFRDFCA